MFDDTMFDDLFDPCEDMEDLSITDSAQSNGMSWKGRIKRCDTRAADYRRISSGFVTQRSLTRSRRTANREGNVVNQIDRKEGDTGIAIKEWMTWVKGEIKGIGKVGGSV